ncbi:hypothetical protein FJY71_04795 [candidate division WOR-3 bacterium]|nr:hypothetical protein [candidate division WOR-3 bacterium]
MTSSCPKRRHRPAIAAGVGMAAVFAVLVTGCGRMPPESFWEPLSADTAGIHAAVQANLALLRIDFDEPSMQVADLVIPESVIAKAIADNPFKQRYRCDSFRQVFNRDTLQGIKGLEYSFIATLDTMLDSVQHEGVWSDTSWIETTATVTLAETIPGQFVGHAYRYTRFLRDSVFETSPGETVRLRYYDPNFTDTSMLVRKPLTAAVIGGCVLRKETGEWRLWKVAGGQRLFAPSPDDAPYLVSFQFASSGRTDTVSLRPDTFHYGIQRFYRYVEPADTTTPCQMLSFAPGDSARIPVVSGYATDVNNFMHFRGVRRRVAPTTRVYFTDPGIYRLYLQQIPFSVFYDIDGALVSLVWGVPLRVTGGGR